jgi:hypothetical protein
VRRKNYRAEVPSCRDVIKEHSMPFERSRTGGAGQNMFFLSALDHAE